MIRVEKFEPEHCQFMTPANGSDRDALQGQMEEATGDVWSFFWEDQLLAIGGMIQQWQGRTIAWLVPDKDSGKHMTALTRFMRVFIEEYGCRRVEMFVDANYRPGWRFALLLGFTNETPVPMRKYMPNGNDAYLYARVF